MKKRLITIIIVLIITAAVVVPAQAAYSGLENFKVSNIYTCGQFNDVEISDWFSMYVQADYEYGLIGGKTVDQFVPYDNLTVAEAVKIAACLNSIYYTGKADFYEGSPWYQTYVTYALQKDILDAPYDDYDVYINRAQFAELIANALPAEAYTAINEVPDGAVPDVALADSYGEAIYTLYEAGVLTGSDSFGTFRPFSLLNRAEAAAIVARAADNSFRKSINLLDGLTGEEIYNKCASAVFYMERYDSEGALLGVGSGFFISRDGLAITNYHIIDGAASAVILTSDGEIYDVKGVCGYDTVADIAIIQIDGSGFDYLTLGDSDTLSVGDRVYAISSPLGLINTMSDGIISNTNQDLNESDYIQFSAPISLGSGGGPILNTSGQVVGVVCLTATQGQTLNFAVPINYSKSLSRTDCVSLISIAYQNAESTVYYAGYYPVPNYGVYVGAGAYAALEDTRSGVKTFYYRTSDITVSDEIAVDGYIDLLTENGFVWQSSYTNNMGHLIDIYYNSDFNMSVHFGIDILNGTECCFVAIH